MERSKVSNSAAKEISKVPEVSKILGSAEVKKSSISARVRVLIKQGKTSKDIRALMMDVKPTTLSWIICRVKKGKF